MSEETERPLDAGDRVRWKKGTGPAWSHINAEAKGTMGDVVMRVVRRHPILKRMIEVEGPDGWSDWVPEDEVWRIK